MERLATDQVVSAGDLPLAIYKENSTWHESIYPYRNYN